MSFYTCNTPVKGLVSAEPLVTKVYQEAEQIELTDAEATDLLASGAISGPVVVPVVTPVDPKAKK